MINSFNLQIMELCINFWFIVDSKSGLVFAWQGKIYCLEGSDEEKIKSLEQLSKGDFWSVERKPLPVNYKLNVDGQVLNGLLALNALNSAFERDIEFFLSELERFLPARQLNFLKSESPAPTNYRTLPGSPLFVKTILFDNREGLVRPISN